MFPIASVSEDKSLQWLTYDQYHETWIKGSTLDIDCSGDETINKACKVLVGNTALYLTHWNGDFFKCDLVDKEWHHLDLERRAAGRFKMTALQFKK